MLRRKYVLLSLLVLVPLILLAGGVAFLTMYGQVQLRDAINEADREDPHWRLPDLEAHRAIVPDTENSAIQVLAAKQALPTDWPHWPTPGLADDSREASEARIKFGDALSALEPPEQLNAQQFAALRMELKRAGPALEMARKLATMPNGRYSVNWARDFISTLLPHAQNAREMATLLADDALLRAQDGDLDGALVSARAALNCGRSLGDEQTLVSQLVRIACDAVARRKIEWILSQGEPSELALAVTQRALAEEAEEPLLLYGVRGERGGTDSFMEMIQNRELSLNQLRGLFGMGMGGRAGGLLSLPDVQAAVLIASARSQRAAMLHHLNEVVDACKLPMPERQRKMDAIAAKLKTGNPALAVRMLAPGIDKAATAAARACAESRCAATALAVERYRRAHGRWPDKLDDLVPAYLAQLAEDPFDGQPLRFKRSGYRVVIYSVGVDGVDNGGNIGPNPMAPNADLGFRLWDLKHRRQPPGPANAAP
jgi:hypothetical protein